MAKCRQGTQANCRPEKSRHSSSGSQQAYGWCWRASAAPRRRTTLRERRPSSSPSRPADRPTSRDGSSPIFFPATSARSSSWRTWTCFRLIQEGAVLQCGHDEFVVENANGVTLIFSNEKASMRPRRVRRGEHNIIILALSLNSGFNAATTSSSWRTKTLWKQKLLIAMLQCGHDEFVVENL